MQSGESWVDSFLSCLREIHRYLDRFTSFDLWYVHFKRNSSNSCDRKILPLLNGISKKVLLSLENEL